MLEMGEIFDKYFFPVQTCELVMLMGILGMVHMTVGGGDGCLKMNENRYSCIREQC